MKKSERNGIIALGIIGIFLYAGGYNWLTSQDWDFGTGDAGEAEDVAKDYPSSVKVKSQMSNAISGAPTTSGTWYFYDSNDLAEASDLAKWDEYQYQTITSDSSTGQYDIVSKGGKHSILAGSTYGYGVIDSSGQVHYPYVLECDESTEAFQFFVVDLCDSSDTFIYCGTSASNAESRSEEAIFDAGAIEMSEGSETGDSSALTAGNTYHTYISFDTSGSSTEGILDGMIEFELDADETGIDDHYFAIVSNPDGILTLSSDGEVLYVAKNTYMGKKNAICVVRFTIEVSSTAGTGTTADGASIGDLVLTQSASSGYSGFYTKLSEAIDA